MVSFGIPLWSQQKEQEACGHWDFRQVTKQLSLSQPGEGDDGGIQEIDLSYQDVRRLGTRRDLLGKMLVEL